MLAYQQLNLRSGLDVSKAVPIDRVDQVVHSVLGLVGEKIYAYIEILCDSSEFTLEKSSSRPSVSSDMKSSSIFSKYINIFMITICFSKSYTHVSHNQR